MNYNLITIDPSIKSNGVVVNGNIISVVDESKAFGKTKLNKWFEICDKIVDFIYINYDYPKNYSESESYKLIKYSETVNVLFDKVSEYLIDGVPTIFAIEGYSYNSEAGHLIDLVTYSTLLRLKFKEIADYIYILSPSTLKLESAKLTYKPTNIGKRVDKFIYQNNEGIKGGSFTKHHMYKALIENENINDEWNDMLKEYASDILSKSKIVKPIEDINDSKLLYEIIKNRIFLEKKLDISF
jgi:hypothetical protein